MISRTRLFLCTTSILGLWLHSAQGQIAYYDSYTQNFNTLPTSATASTFNLPGWISSDTTIQAADGSAPNTSAPTGLLSSGTTGSTERALGTAAIPANIPSFAVRLTNNSGATIPSIDISYYGEQWRKGATTSEQLQTLDFAYSVGATTLTDASFINYDALDFTGPIATNSATTPDFVRDVTALDGNAAANRILVRSTLNLTGTPWLAGTTIWLRWTDRNDPDFDSTLAVDDLTVMTSPVPEPSASLALLTGLACCLSRFRRRG